MHQVILIHLEQLCKHGYTLDLILDVFSCGIQCVNSSDVSIHVFCCFITNIRDLLVNCQQNRLNRLTVIDEGTLVKISNSKCQRRPC